MVPAAAVTGCDGEEEIRGAGKAFLIDLFGVDLWMRFDKLMQHHQCGSYRQFILRLLNTLESSRKKSTVSFKDCRARVISELGVTETCVGGAACLPSEPGTLHETDAPDPPVGSADTSNSSSYTDLVETARQIAEITDAAAAHDPTAGELTLEQLVAEGGFQEVHMEEEKEESSEVPQHINQISIDLHQLDGTQQPATIMSHDQVSATIEEVTHDQQEAADLPATSLPLCVYSTVEPGQPHVSYYVINNNSGGSSSITSNEVDSALGSEGEDVTVSNKDPLLPSISKEVVDAVVQSEAFQTQFLACNQPVISTIKSETGATANLLHMQPAATASPAAGVSTVSAGFGQQQSIIFTSSPVKTFGEVASPTKVIVLPASSPAATDNNRQRALLQSEQSGDVVRRIRIEPHVPNVDGQNLRGKQMVPRKRRRKNNPVTCEQCSKKCSSQENLNRHMVIHSTNKKHKCDYCTQTFKRSDTMCDHMKAKHRYQLEASGVSLALPTCNQCHMTFIRPGLLKDHVKNRRCETNCSEPSKPARGRPSGHRLLAEQQPLFSHAFPQHITVTTPQTVLQ